MKFNMDADVRAGDYPSYMAHEARARRERTQTSGRLHRTYVKLTTSETLRLERHGALCGRCIGDMVYSAVTRELARLDMETPAVAERVARGLAGSAWHEVNQMMYSADEFVDGRAVQQ